MEDMPTNEPKPLAQPASHPGGVMDVQAPRPQGASTLHMPVGELDHPVVDDLLSPTHSQTSQLHSTEPTHYDHQPPVPTNAHAHHPDEGHHPLLAAHAQRRPVPLVAIIVAIVIAVGLAGLAVYVYKNSKSTTYQEADHSSSETPQTPAGATTTDVDATSKEVDDTLNSANDTADLPESDITDQTLGL